MWQTQAVLSLLLEEIAELRGDRHEAPSKRFEGDLGRARRRATMVVVIDWAAIVVLLLASDAGGAFLTLGPRLETILTVGLLAIGTHSGFRLGQLQKYAAVARAGRELLERDAGGQSRN